MAIFLNNSPVKVVSNGTTFGSEPEPIIPREYQAVEWVCAEYAVGTYIDLGFNFDIGATVYLTQWISSETVTAYPFGAVENSGVLRCNISSPLNNTYAYFYGSNGTEYIGTRVDVNIDGSKTELIFTIKPKNMYLENITTGTVSTIMKNQASYTMSSNLYLFAQNYNGSPRWGGTRKLGKFKYYDKNDILICDLVPCYRKSDGEIGMYDNVRRIFLTNVGTGKFTKGADVLY